MDKNILQQCRMIKLTSAQFRTQVEHGWPYEELGVALVHYEPWLAKELFATRHHNRAISPTDQKKIATALAMGRWRVNGQSIILSQEMRVINGQNRLHACLDTNRELTSVTVWGVVFETAESMDIGKKHSGADILAQHEIPDASAVAAALRTYYKIAQHALPTVTVQLPDYAIVEYQKIHQKIHYSLAHGVNVRRFLPPSLGTALHYAFRLKVQDTSDDEQALPDVLFAQLAQGENISSRDPVYVLRELLSLRRSKDKRIKQSLDEKEYAQLGAQTINTWNALRQHRSITRAGLIWNEDTRPFPEIL